MPWGGNYFFFIPSAELRAQSQNTASGTACGGDLMPSSRTLQPCDLLEHGGPNLVPFCSGSGWRPFFIPHYSTVIALQLRFGSKEKWLIKIPNEHDSCSLNDPFAINPWKNIYYINRGCDLSQWGCCRTWAGLLIVKSCRHWSHGVFGGGYNCLYKIPKDTKMAKHWMMLSRICLWGGRVSFEALWTCVARSAECICMCFTVGYITAPSHPPGWILCLLLRTGAALLSAAAAGNI